MKYYEIGVISHNGNVLPCPLSSREMGSTICEGIMGEIIEIFPIAIFTNKTGSKKGHSGKVLSLLIENKIDKICGAPVWQYRITIWDDIIDKFDFLIGHAYHLTNFRQKLNRNSFDYCGQSNFDIVLTPKTHVVELKEDHSGKKTY